MEKKTVFTVAATLGGGIATLIFVNHMINKNKNI